MRNRCKTEWVWGPIAAYKLPLAGLDTEGRAGELSVMELTTESLALENTKEMLLDSFMNGFIFHLFIDKWYRWARYYWAAQLGVNLLLVCSLTVMASPSILGRNAPETDLKLLASVCLCCMAYLLLEQVRELFTFLYRHWRNLRRSEDARSSLMQDWLLGRIDNWVLIASMLFVCRRLVSADDPQEANAKTEVRVMVAIAATLAWLQIFFDAFVPFERFGVFVQLVSRMLFGDMFTWVVIVIPFVLGLTTSANAVSQGATESPFVGEGGHSLAFWPYALESFVLMFTNGVTPGFRVYTYEDAASVDQSEEDVEGRLLAVKKRSDGAEKEDMDYPSLLALDENYSPMLVVWFYVFYLTFCYIVLVMLLNLLIAMMGNTCALDRDRTTPAPPRS